MYKCKLCGAEFPLFGNVMWCDKCIDEFLDHTNKLNMTELIEKKRKESSEHLEVPSTPPPADSSGSG